MSSLFRADPRRCIHVGGEIGPEMLGRLTPKILELQFASREPITVYIDSQGGSVQHCRRLLSMLRAPAQEGSNGPCRIITVVTNTAASAAAVMLCEGDYAISYPNAIIHFHGIRYQADRDVTAELASDMTEQLRLSNHQSALALANRCFERLTFQYVGWRARTGAVRFDQFLEALKSECGAQELVQKAEERTAQYRLLLAMVKNDLRTTAPPEADADWTPEGAEFEAAVLRSLITSHLAKHNGGASNFSDGGLIDLTQDFYLVMEYLSVLSEPTFARLSGRWGSVLLSDIERAEIAELPEAERPEAKARKVEASTSRELRPLWLFEAALCHSLQEDEFRLRVPDAVRLGLIDEEIGGSATTLRDVVESAREPTPPQAN